MCNIARNCWLCYENNVLEIQIFCFSNSYKVARSTFWTSKDDKTNWKKKLYSCSHIRASVFEREMETVHTHAHRCMHAHPHNLLVQIKTAHMGISIVSTTFS